MGDREVDYLLTWQVTKMTLDMSKAITPRISPRATQVTAFPEGQSHREHRITKDASPISVGSSTLKTVILYENERITAEPYYR